MKNQPPTKNELSINREPKTVQFYQSPLAEPLPANFPDLELGREIGRIAMTKMDEAARYALVAGQWLCELKDAIEHGEFENAVRQHCPWFRNRSIRTLQDWTRAAAKVAEQIQTPLVDVGLKPSEILWASQESIKNLPSAAQAYRTEWFTLIRDRTIKDCIAGLFGGDAEGCDVERAINGKFKGGTNQFDDRKGFSNFYRK